MIETNTPTLRSRGRPPSINRVAALDAAVLTFWEKGYEGASLTDLTQAMKISRPSLYSGFGDKAKLFDEALIRYAQTIGNASMRAFEAEPDIGKAVRDFLSVSAKGNTLEGHPRGCLIGCCAPAAAETDLGIRERLEQLLSATQNHLVDRFDSETGLPDNLLSRDRATMMLDFMNAQAIRARAGATLIDLLEDLEMRTQSVLGFSRSCESND
jgi:AcrR family transcriptional regulator